MQPHITNIEEFRVLTSEKIKTYINENNIELIGFNEI
jgi:predicted glycoside hydrolase/deacetylase ChbG (UPF0249 family)